ncbi:MAG: hypothetical protein CO144_01885 [Candidatus Nealsonbacteria bacterium CG_4_9_14_3_um_filter_35_11]|uniref:DHHA1 domain-containing protein n=2 Tax=Candidatus Nealsoniibacteriota TaxID=1817911 RepID=A0A2M7DB49_9BACT|nr:MAG: hypothetical protein COV62_01775 [Candidatus Nealsonbacteria bacterium CG11_big_fil_rev_8_21_14_0_20_35_11]PIV45627.1 MAG: hypothetical protein COS24_01285 [Candidatus Nealsonbacteria bacterium CG02_land_8_20_14_3_00_34_20]PIW92412.1 MAG: hypothetical protein COZ88_02275 [Candidatus Nealsonbacteria bacterium CG_4_8_14_3_um_filter_34_13]PIZ89943.1 MAG: hypothetical protein COX88_01055 [Candidatus Nealsonbacteria bacterium CG_4_10_14_0_2_um_filter_35_20]PJA84403.1 MAG: hypothetical protei
MPEFIKIKNIIDEAINITILTKINADEDATAAALALYFSLKNLNKNVNLPAVKKLPPPLFFLLKQLQQKTFLISLKKDVSEIYYKKIQSGINLYLKPKTEQINLEDFSFKNILAREFNNFGEASPFPRIDTLITLGLQNFQEVEKFLNGALSQPYPAKILNVDNNFLNQRFGEINLIKPYSSLSQAIAYLLKNLDEKLINKITADCLLAGMVSSAGNFQKPKITQEILPTINWLIKKGGNLQLMHEGKGERPLARAKILDRVLKKLSFLKEQSLYFSSLTEKDFRETESCSKDLSFIVEKVKFFLKIPSFLLLWESYSSKLTVKGIFYSKERKLLKKIKENFEGTSRGDGTLFLVRESNILTAQKEVLKTLT